MIHSNMKIPRILINRLSDPERYEVTVNMDCDAHYKKFTISEGDSLNFDDPKVWNQTYGLLESLADLLNTVYSYGQKNEPLMINFNKRR